MPDYYGTTATAGDRTWVAWVTTTAASNYTSTTATAATWNQWTTTCSTTTASIDTVWVTWVGDEVMPLQFASPVLTPAERNARLEAERVSAEKWKRQAEEEKAKRIAAEKRAKELLESILGPEERERLATHNHIHVCGKSGKRYRVRRGRSGNLDVIDKDGVITHRACVHVAEAVPDYDNMVAQKLRLEDDDEALLKVANLTPLPREAPVMERVLH